MLRTYTNNDSFEPDSMIMSDSAMIEMLDGRPLVNVDILLVDRQNKKLILPTRRAKPAEGLWFIGGGIKRNQDFKEAAQATFKRETGVELSLERFKFLAVNRFVWDYRDQAPPRNGRVDINFCFSVDVTGREIDKVQLNQNEYDINASLKGYDRAALEIALQEESPIKAVILDYFDYLF